MKCDRNSRCNPSRNELTKTGLLGEKLVAQWLSADGWEILHRRWRCRWGEIDIIARSLATAARSSQLAFVEVKTRSRGNWDANGLLSVTLQKRTKLWRTAEVFLGTYPELADLPCRFDVALVRCDRLNCPGTRTSERECDEIRLGSSVYWSGFQLTLLDYIVDILN
ncbi:MAG: YraN family protein [Cyanobacteria bacterium SID2]|nr:YraN family protein [Cyanobacteria bacterium SID2]MBP0004668.1 YraN family protein [Cyanobacteria bacterium SBC]